MQTSLISKLAQAFFTQAQSTPLNSATIVFMAIALAAGLGSLWLWSQINNHKNAIEELNATITNYKSSARDMKAIERKLQNSLKDKNENLQKLKKDLANQRKKTHSAQQDVKKIREEGREKIKQANAKLHASPVFQPKPLEIDKPSSSPKKTTPENNTNHPANPASQNLPTESDIIGQLRNELAKTREDRDKAVGKLKANSNKFKQAQSSVREMKFRVEKYRRVDIMTKNQLELANDKLLTLGRQYYDAVSELAAMQGQVVPPKPKELRQAEAAAQKAAEQAAALESEEQSPQSHSPVTFDSIDLGGFEDETAEKAQQNPAQHQEPTMNVIPVDSDKNLDPPPTSPN